MEASQSPPIEGVLLWRLCKAPSVEGLHYGGFTKPLYRTDFVISGQNMPPKAFSLGCFFFFFRVTLHDDDKNYFSVISFRIRIHAVCVKTYISYLCWEIYVEDYTYSAYCGERF